MFLRFVLLCLCITPLLPLSGLDYMVPGSHPAAANATNSTALTRELSLSLSLCQAFCPPILLLATEQWPSSLPEHYMVPSGRSKDRYLPLPVPYTCPHNPAPPLYLHATTRCEHAPSRKPPRLKLQAVSPPAPRQSGDTPASRWAWALLAPCYACLHDATGTRTCHAAVIPP